MTWTDQIENSLNHLFAAIPRSKPHALKLHQTRIIAHRGAHDAHITENTQAAFSQAVALGCWGIELDIHATRDGVWVVNHDATLKRLWRHDKAIKALSFQELRTLVPDIPTLKEVITTHQNVHFFIEIKEPAQNYHHLAELLSSLSAADDYHLLVLDAKLAFELAQVFVPAAILLVATHINTAYFCRLSMDAKFGGVLGHYLLLTQAKIRALKAANQQVGVGFIDSKNSLYREINRGMLWVFSNNVQALLNTQG